MRAIYQFKWKCPNCQHEQIDEIDPVLGPSNELLCEQCNKTTDFHNDKAAEDIRREEMILELEKRPIPPFKAGLDH